MVRTEIWVATPYTPSAFGRMPTDALQATSVSLPFFRAHGSDSRRLPSYVSLIQNMPSIVVWRKRHGSVVNPLQTARPCGERAARAYCFYEQMRRRINQLWGKFTQTPATPSKPGSAAPATQLPEEFENVAILKTTLSAALSSRNTGKSPVSKTSEGLMSMSISPRPDSGS